MRPSSPHRSSAKTWLCQFHKLIEISLGSVLLVHGRHRSSEFVCHVSQLLVVVHVLQAFESTPTTKFFQLACCIGSSCYFCFMVPSAGCMDGCSVWSDRSSTCCNASDRCSAQRIDVQVVPTVENCKLDECDCLSKISYCTSNVNSAQGSNKTPITIPSGGIAVATVDCLIDGQTHVRELLGNERDIHTTLDPISNSTFTNHQASASVLAIQRLVAKLTDL
mmetsp:Transcript_79586/g.140481  ORF Transcript_79586/g.140481 Transcript_79586/m.140481 type:complete len:221 (-) Transcript_79586:310-972(-)